VEAGEASRDAHQLSAQPGPGALITTVPVVPVIAHPEQSRSLERHPDRVQNFRTGLGGLPPAGSVHLPPVGTAYGVNPRRREKHHV
jgi:hypothetical protein